MRLRYHPEVQTQRYAVLVFCWRGMFYDVVGGDGDGSGENLWNWRADRCLKYLHIYVFFIDI